MPRRAARIALVFAGLSLVSLATLSCNTSGLKRVFMAPDSQGTISRDAYVAGSPIFCIADVAIGDPQATVEVSMQPVSVNGKPTGLPPLLIGEIIPGRFSGKLATEFPRAAVQAIPDARDPGKFTIETTAQAPGLYRCVVKLDDELDYAEFAVLPGQQATNDPNAPQPGACSKDTVASCPLAGGSGMVRCCTPAGACGTGPEGTGFCYPSK